MRIRQAAPEDLADIQAIYAEHVLHGTGTFEEAPPSLEEMAARFQDHQAGGFGWLVAQDAGFCLGYGYYGPFRRRAAYRFTVEDSVYVRAQARRQGVGRALLAGLLAGAAASGFREMLALIGDGENAASLRLHESLGFWPVGTMRRVGYKFERWLDVVTMQKTLDAVASGNKF